MSKYHTGLLLAKSPTVSRSENNVWRGEVLRATDCIRAASPRSLGSRRSRSRHLLSAEAPSKHCSGTGAGAGVSQSDKWRDV